MKSDLINASNVEDAIAEKARTHYTDAWNLALETEDDELFENVWNQATILVMDDLLTLLIEQGHVQVAGMTEQGDMMFSLNKAGTTTPV